MGVEIVPRTATASFTLASGYGVRLRSATLGSGSAITTFYGLYLDTQSVAGTNYAIYTNLGLVRFGDTVDTTASYQVDGTQVVTNRVTGYTNAMTGTADRATSYATSTITLPQLAERVKAIQDDLTTHGLIGA